MKRYVLSFADSVNHVPEHPERTAKRSGKGMNFDVTWQVWPSREAMLKTVQMQQRREPRPDDWHPYKARASNPARRQPKELIYRDRRIVYVPLTKRWAIQEKDGSATYSHAVTLADAKWQVDQNQARASNPSRRSIHTARWDDCVRDVKKKGGRYDPYAVCTARLGYRGSVKAGHRRSNPAHDSRLRELEKKRDRAMDQLGADWQSEFTDEELRELGRLQDDARSQNPLPETRPVYYAVRARKAYHTFWLSRHGKLVRLAKDAARFRTVKEAEEAARAHLTRYDASRAYRFEVTLAY